MSTPGSTGPGTRPVGEAAGSAAQTPDRASAQGGAVRTDQSRPAVAPSQPQGSQQAPQRSQPVPSDAPPSTAAPAERESGWRALRPRGTERSAPSTDGVPATTPAGSSVGTPDPAAGSAAIAAEASSTQPVAGRSRPDQPAQPSRRAQQASASAPRATPRRVKLIVSRLDPWSVMKISFLLSVAIGIAGVVLVGVLWTILQGMGVFTQVNSVVNDVLSSQSNPSSFSLMDYIGFGRVISLSVVLGVVDVILLTAISTLLAFLYNICSALVGGLQVTLSDD